MEIFTFIFSALILAETTILLYKKYQKTGPIKKARRKVYIDTSALMDGRILFVAKTGFIGDDLIIPRSVIREMQLLADGKDSEKRARARAGMDVVSELERIIFFDTEILQDELDKTPVDERLLELAKQNKGLILTCDFNLIKVATTENIEVLNINDLALALRSDFLPGDKAKIKIVATGSNPKQGVGYLPDGTMAIVDNAAKKVDQEVEIEFVRFLQTSAGRMMFAKLTKAKSVKPTKSTKSTKSSSSPRSRKSR